MLEDDRRVTSLPWHSDQGGDSMDNKIGYFAPAQRYFLISVWLFAGIAFFVLTSFNLATVSLTHARDGSGLRAIESILIGVCHRMPSRSFWVYDIPLGLCARCTGIYLAAFISFLTLSFKPDLFRVNSLIALAMLAPLLVDSILEHYSLYAGTNFLRFATGLLFGIGIVILLHRALLKLTTTNHQPWSQP